MVRFQGEQERNRRETDELDRMARQMNAEVEKLGQREVSAGSQLRNLVANIDRFSQYLRQNKLPVEQGQLS